MIAFLDVGGMMIKEERIGLETKQRSFIRSQREIKV